LGVLAVDPPPAPTPAATQSNQQAAAPAKTTAGGLHLELPGCVKDGNCRLDDIVKTGVAFANLLMTLSAAFFFASIIYGGAMYLLSFGEKERVAKGKSAITGAAIGMTIVLFSWTIVNYVASAILGKI
jgi:hypothetical protein